MFCDCKRTNTHMWCDGRAYALMDVKCYFDWVKEERSKEQYWNNVNKYNKEQTNMTRQEAKNLVKKQGYAEGYAENFIDTLEALGLIKFEEEKNPPTAKDIISMSGYNADNLISKLEANGYRIVKLGKYTQVQLKDNDGLRANELISISQPEQS